MHRLVPSGRRSVFAAGRGAVRISRRRFSAEAAEPKKKPRIFRRILYSTTAAVGAFYVASPFVAFKNQPYYDFFSDHVPLGQSMLEFAEARNWDTMTVKSAVESAKNTASSVQKSVMDKIKGTSSTVEQAKEKTEKKTQEVKKAVVKTIQDSKAKIQEVASTLKTEVTSGEVLDKAGAIAKHRAHQLSHEVQAIVHQAEQALAGKYPEHVTNPAPSSPKAPPVVSGEAKGKVPEPTAGHVYDIPLPVGFEPPPGFSRPKPPPARDTDGPKEPSFPLVAPSISNFADAEPILIHLAGTIDNLTRYIKSNAHIIPQVAPVIENAKTDLAALADRIDKARAEERDALEKRLDEQTREFTVKMLDLEMASQDRLDHQEEEFKQVFDQERLKIVHAYREKIENELMTQTELINERLKEQVIAQGIELQRRWIREIKVRVEQERGGRLARLDELSSQLKKVERIALDNSVYLDENIRVHALWSAIRTVSTSALSSPVRKPFREELRVLRHVACAKEDPLVSAALGTLEASDVPDVGVEPFADLASWFSTSVAPKVSSVALVPDKGAGVLSHLASHILSSIQFKRHGLVEGDDLLSVLARAEYYLNEKDLDTATRELNQLQGTARVLLRDWLQAARQRLEVQQALEVVQTQATLASLLVV